MMLHPIFIDDENEVDEKVSSSDEEEGEDDDVTRVRKRRKRGIDPDFVDGFVFDVTDETKGTADNLEGLGRYLKKTVAVSLDEKIARVRKERRIEQPDLQLPDEPDQELSHVTDRVNEKKRNKSAVDQSFFESSVADANYGMTFSEMNLSRPILKAISACGFTSPTPIQAACIPLALAGRDICACASTGTGKTAAFMLPILERLLYKPRRQAVSRVLVLVPTRELAIQVFQVPPFNK